MPSFITNLWQILFPGNHVNIKHCWIKTLKTVTSKRISMDQFRVANVRFSIPKFLTERLSLFAISVYQSNCFPSFAVLFVLFATHSKPFNTFFRLLLINPILVNLSFQFLILHCELPIKCEIK